MRNKNKNNKGILVDRPYGHHMMVVRFLKLGLGLPKTSCYISVYENVNLKEKPDLEFTCRTLGAWASGFQRMR